MLASIGETIANDSRHARGRLAPAIYLRETFPPERKAPNIEVLHDRFHVNYIEECAAKFVERMFREFTLALNYLGARDQHNLFPLVLSILILKESQKFSACVKYI